MDYTVATVTSRVQNVMDNAALSNSLVLQFMNDYQRDVGRRLKLPVWQTTATVTSTINSDTLAGLPTDMLVPISLRMTDPYDFKVPYAEYADVDELYPDPDTDGTGMTTLWYSYGAVPKLYPRADAVYTYKLRYVQIPTQLVGQSDVPAIPEVSSECLVLGCQVRALIHDDQATKAQLIQQQLDKLEINMFQPGKRGPFTMPLPNKRRRIARI